MYEIRRMRGNRRFSEHKNETLPSYLRFSTRGSSLFVYITLKQKASLLE